MNTILGFRFESMSFTEMLLALIGGGVLVILLVAIIAVIARRGKTPPGAE